MKAAFSPSWKSSSQPRKQRKYKFNAPAHIKNKFMGAHLSKALKEKTNKRTLPLRIGDKVRVLRGNFKKKEGKVAKVNRREEKVYIENIDTIKKDGNKIFIPFNPSNLLIIEIIEDKRRLKRTKAAKEA